MIACIHQPQFLPYLGFFHKVAQCDVYVVLDDVMATRKDFTNRNRVKGPRGVVWMTVPVRKKNNIVIRDIEISSHINWVDKHLNTIQHLYGGAPFFDSCFIEIKKIYEKVRWNKIVDIDVEFLRWVFGQLDIDVSVEFSSSLNVESRSTQRLVDICRRVGADTYLSGVGGRNYMDLGLFEENGIAVEFQRLEHPVYQQRFGGFVEGLSVVDLLFNCGEKSVEIVRGGG